MYNIYGLETEKTTLMCDRVVFSATLFNQRTEASRRLE